MIRVFTAFSGYDSQCLALNMLRGEEDNPNIHSKDGYMYIFNYELVGWSEIDKYAIKAHNALFPQWTDRNYGDISEIDWAQVPDFDLFTYSSPCQDFSQAGKQRGAAKGSGTRSSLLWECERAIEIKRPKYLLFENVSAVVSKKFIRLFNEWQLTLERLGYTNFTQVLNAKTHGFPTPVPQNRERVFMVSILNCDKPFYFPDPQPLTQRLADVLEPDVDDSYYLSDVQVGNMLRNSKGNGFDFNPKSPDDIAQTLYIQKWQKTDIFIKEDIKEAEHETPTRQIRDDEPRILDLSLCYQWYDMIASGEKTEEYREIKDYWLHRLTNIQFFTGELEERDMAFAKRYDAVRFHRGQGGKTTMLFECKELTIGFGKPEQGAPADKRVFIIRLGKRIENPDCVINQRGHGFNKGGEHEICPTITGGAFVFNNTIREPIVLGWTRDEKGNVTDRHPVEVANAVTAAKRDNTQNYVIEQIRKKHPNRGIFWQDGKAYYIRKLTPRECFRLMGVSDADIDKIQAAGISKSQQYKMAGNSIVVNCLAAIFRQLFIGNFNKVQQTEIF